jgi:hypothetical protein
MCDPDHSINTTHHKKFHALDLSLFPALKKTRQDRSPFSDDDIVAQVNLGMHHDLKRIIRERNSPVFDGRSG